MTKEEKIKEVYNKYFKINWDKTNFGIDFITGECRFVSKYFNMKYAKKNEFDLIRHELSGFACGFIPKSLQGIKDNNGWIKIKSEEDLPKEKGYFMCLYEDGEIIPHHFSINSEFDRELFLEEFTHYRPMHKPELPIY